jgi:hypothetical protein
MGMFRTLIVVNAKYTDSHLTTVNTDMSTSDHHQTVTVGSYFQPLRLLSLRVSPSCLTLEFLFGIKELHILPPVLIFYLALSNFCFQKTSRHRFTAR